MKARSCVLPGYSQPEPLTGAHGGILIGMDPKRTGTALIALLAVLSLGWGGMYYYAKRAEVATSSQQPQTSPEAQLESISLKHEAEGDMHTYTGTIETPTPCYSVAAALAVNYTEPPQGTINITTEENSDGVCAQVMTSQEFSVALSSAAAPEIKVIIDGKERQVAVVEAK